MYTTDRYGRFWAVLHPSGTLVAVCVYLKGATEVARTLNNA